MNSLRWVSLVNFILDSKKQDEFIFLYLRAIQKLHPFPLLISYKKNASFYQVTNASNVSEVDRQSEFIELIEKKILQNLGSQFEVLTIEHEEQALGFSHIAHFPINDNVNNKSNLGIVGFINKPLSKNEEAFFTLFSKHIAKIHHAIYKKTLKQRIRGATKRKVLLIIILIFLIGLIPLPQRILAKAEVMPINPEIVSSSIEGVIKSIFVLPNETVKAGQTLIQLDEIILKNKLEESEQALNTFKQRYLKAYRNAYKDPDARAELLVLENEVNQAKLDVSYHRGLLSRAKISAKKSGVVLFSSPSDFLGKPIKIGQKIMLIASSRHKKINFWIPIDYISQIDNKKLLTFYPNLHPLKSIKVRLNYINPIAEKMDDGTLGYFGETDIISGDVTLGERGTLKIYGNKASIWVQLFQRPFRFIRQALGI